MTPSAVELAHGLVLTNQQIERQIMRLHLSLVDLADSKLTCRQLGEQLSALADANARQRDLLDRALAGAGGRDGNVHAPAA